MLTQIDKLEADNEKNECKADFIVADSDETQPFYRSPLGKKWLPRLSHWSESDIS